MYISVTAQSQITFGQKSPSVSTVAIVLPNKVNYQLIKFLHLNCITTQ